MPSAHPFTQTLDLSELPQWSPWPARLLSLEDFTSVDRTTAKIEEEYNKDKYAACLEYLEKNPSATFAELKSFELGGDTEREMCISIGETLYRTTFGEARSYQSDLTLSLIDPFVASADVICELGCGYGFNLSLLIEKYPDKTCWGGEYSSNAVEVANKLFADSPNASVEQLDFTDPAFNLPEGENVFVFTVHAIEQIPTCASMIKRLTELKGPQWRFCHLEPVSEFCSDSLLGLLRKSYTECCDYNRDLFTNLDQSDAVQIETVEKDVFGINPLNPASFISWK